MKRSVIVSTNPNALGELELIRGLPGSGKSTYAKNLTETIVLETDMWWYRNPEGEYRFDIGLISRAHRWCLQTAESFIAAGMCVAVANTNLTFSEAKNYIGFAKAIGCPITITTMDRDVNYGSIHNVPESVLEKMRNRMEDHETFMEKVYAYQPDGTEGICREQSQVGEKPGI